MSGGGAVCAFGSLAAARAGYHSNGGDIKAPGAGGSRSSARGLIGSGGAATVAANKGGGRKTTRCVALATSSSSRAGAAGENLASHYDSPRQHREAGRRERLLRPPRAMSSNPSYLDGAPPSINAESFDEASTGFTEFIAETKLPTDRGFYRLRGYRHSVDGAASTEPVAIVYGDVEGKEEVPVRVHDACFTSEVLGSLKCDCKQQLQLAMEYIQARALLSQSHARIRSGSTP